MPCSKSTETRFWEKVNKTDTCWLWTASTCGKGYGVFRLAGKQDTAHRASWKLNCGPIPAGQHVLHRCDTRLCIRPDHLFLGTNQDNVDDMWKKGRGLVGEKHPQAKLTTELVIEIRLKKAAGATYEELQKEYGFGTHTLCCVCNRKTWKHV